MTARELAAALAYDAECEAAQTAAEAYHDRVMNDPHTCEHGHGGCADSDGGQCSDEMLQRAGL